MAGAILFDLDGTLLDTVPDLRASLNETLVEFGYATLSYEQVCAYVGDGARKLVERALPPRAKDVDVVYATFRQKYATCSNELTRVYEGIPELLARWKARGVKLAVVTNKPQEATRQCIEKFFPGMFDFVGGDSGMFECKPDPSLARYAALAMHASMRECIFVGDGETDVLTARNAGMVGISTLWGYRDRAQLETVRAKLFAETPAELEKILERFF